MTLDESVAWCAWLASLAAAGLYPWTVWLVLATTLNLLHARWNAWFAGTPLDHRIEIAINLRLIEMQDIVDKMEKDVADIRESQTRMMGVARGRQLPG